MSTTTNLYSLWKITLDSGVQILEWIGCEVSYMAVFEIIQFGVENSGLNEACLLDSVSKSEV